MSESYYGPDELPKLVGGEYDRKAIEGYVVDCLEEVICLGSSDELGQRRLQQGKDISGEFIIEHATGSFVYTVQKTISPDFIQYSIEPMVSGPLEPDYDKDLLEKMPSVGVGYLRIVVGVSKDNFDLVSQQIGEEGIENIHIKDPEEMVHFGNIVNLLKPTRS